MESFAEMLTAGGHANSLGRAGEVHEIVECDASRLDELFTCIFNDDAWVRMRAIDTFEKLVAANPALAQPYIPVIFDKLTMSDQASIQWHVAQLFGEVELTDKQCVQAIAWLKQKLATTEIDWIVAANCMKTLVHFKNAGYVAADELTPLFTVQLSHTSKSVHRKASDHLAKL